ncbi:gustatory receptor 23a-like [Zeugodacus cucurbitae]|uniref:gustatory receptor 23a-like n=1 Tax=Zeugodacus cucurbitae TaxID=28588 RepID=UPI0023D91D7C|nr:gustatory receptor 23a-like [Zeugodacus cucurbitae]
MYYRKIFASFARYHLLALMYLLLLQPVPRLPWVTSICRLIWLAWLTIPGHTILYSLLTDSFEKLGHIVGSVLFTFKMLTNFVTYVESMCKAKHYQQLRRLEDEVDAMLRNHIDVTATFERKRWLRVFYCTLIQITYDILQLVVIFKDYMSPVFYYSMPMLLIERARYAQITFTIERQNERSLSLTALLRVLVKANRPKNKYTSDVWQPYASWEYENLNSVRLLQGRLCELYQCVGTCYGWSIIVLLFTTFFTAVANIFWCIEIVSSDFRLGQFMYDALTMLRLTTLAVVLLITADKARQHNIQISGLIFKLAKPIGNKTYNDLVSNFSLQCLQQRLFINVKGFFTLNLPLLGDSVREETELEEDDSNEIRKRNFDIEKEHCVGLITVYTKPDEHGDA